MFVAIRRYVAVDPDSADEVARRANEGFIPIIKDAPGFQAYYLVNGGGGVVTTVSVFDDQAGAEESNRLAADWIGQNLASLLPNPPEITAGEVGAHATSAGPVGAVSDTVGGVSDTVGGTTSTLTDTAGGLLGGGKKDQDKS